MPPQLTEMQVSAQASAQFCGWRSRGSAKIVPVRISSEDLNEVAIITNSGAR